MQHNFEEVFDTSSPYWQRVLDIFDKNEKYEKKIVSGRNLHHKFPRSFSKKMTAPYRPNYSFGTRDLCDECYRLNDADIEVIKQKYNKCLEKINKT